MLLTLVAYVSSVYAPPGQSSNHRNLHILQIYHIIPLIDVHEIFSQYHVYFFTGSYFAQILKMALLSLSLNLLAQYCTQSWTQSGTTSNQGIIDLIYVNLKL